MNIAGTPRNISHDETATATDDFFRQAAKVFPPKVVAKLKERGHDFVEAGSQGAFIRDAEGVSYIDCYTSAGTFNLGRRNGAVCNALSEAARVTDQGNFVVVSEEKARLAEKLASFTPKGLDCMLFTVVRGEAFEAACKLARGYTGKKELITVDGGWYGQTGFALSLSSRDDLDQFAPLIPQTKTIPFNDQKTASAMISRNTAAVILEPVQAENGCRRADPEFLAGIRRLCDRHGSLLIYDESQTGFGRTGLPFAMEHYGILPDIAILGEAMAAGVFPMTAIVFTPKVKSFFDEHPLIHLCTFGGHDIGCLVAVRAIEEYERTAPWENARKMGDRLMNGLSGLVKKSGPLVSVSGVGLLLSMTFEDENTARRFCAHAKENGGIFVPGKVARHTVPIRPVLTITEKETDLIIACIEKSLRML